MPLQALSFSVLDSGKQKGVGISILFFPYLMKMAIACALFYVSFFHLNAIQQEGEQTVSIIIPVLNEKPQIEPLVTRLNQLYPKPEVLFVDGGSQDGTSVEIERLGATVIYSSQANRGKQLNLGASQAHQSIFLFLHADTWINQEAYSVMLKNLYKTDVLGGAFSYALQGSQEDWRLRVIEGGTYLRTHWMHMPYGDQGFFIKKEGWNQIGPFKELALMEDVEWFDRLKQTNRYVILEESVLTSPRRILKRGWLWSSVLNLALVTLYRMGVRPDYLAYFYYGGQTPGQLH